MLVLSRADVESVLDLDALVDALAAAMAELSEGRAAMPARIAVQVPERHALLAAMPAYLPSAGALTTKLVSLFPDNTEHDTHQAVLCCFDPDHGTPVAVLDGTSVTAARTAAGSVLATRLLARADSRVVAILGTGVEARAHAIAMHRRPGVEVIRVAGRDPVKRDALVAELTADGLPTEAAPSMQDAVSSADIVCATTHTDDPVVRRAWLRPGTHVNSVGYNTTGQGEVDGETVRDAVVVVEHRASALAPPPSGAVELLLAIEHGLIGRDHIRAEIGELVRGTVAGRTDDEQITLYKSVGVAVQDAAAAALLVHAARAQNVGTEVAM